MLDKCKKAGSAVIDVLALVLLGLVFAANLIWTCHVSYDDAEIVSYSVSPLYLVFVPVALLCVYLYAQIAARADTRKLFRIFSAAYVIAGAYLIFNTEAFIRADASSVWTAAGTFLKGFFPDLKSDGYLSMFPFQLGMVSYDMLLRLFSDNVKILYAVNLLEVLVINRLCFRITESLFGDETVSRIVVLLAFAFVPQLLFILFGYGLIPGFCCFMAALYFCIRVYKNAAAKDVLLMILFSVLASLLKPNFKIGVIAMAIVLLLKPGENGKAYLRLLITAALVLLCSFASFHLVKLSYSAVSGADIGGGTPIDVYIAMGTDLDNNVRAPGWYDGYTFSAYPDAGYDTQAAAQSAREKIKANLAESAADPARAAGFYWRKMISTWCEPMFQSAWSGPKGDGLVAKPLLQSLYTGGSAEKFIGLFSKANVVIILAASLCFVLTQRRKYPFARVLYLYFTGGFLFHLLSETKSQYVYMYIFALLPMAAYELGVWIKLLRARLKRAMPRKEEAAQQELLEKHPEKNA